MEVFPSDHGQQEVINNFLDVQKDTVKPKLDSLSDKDDLKALQDWEGQEKERYWVWVQGRTNYR